MSTTKAKTGSKKSNQSRSVITVSLLPKAHKNATLACNLVEPSESLLDFLSRAANDRALPILKKHGVRVPDEVSQTT